MVRQSTGVLDRCRQATSRTQCRPRSEFRSGAAAREDAEFVPLRVGKYDPTLVALADVGVLSTEIEQRRTSSSWFLSVGLTSRCSLFLMVLASGTRECQRRWHRANTVPVLRHQR